MSPVVHPYTFELVGVSPLTLPYTLVSIFCTRLRQKTPTQKIFLSMHVYSTIPSTVQYLTIKYRASVPSTYFFQLHCKHHPITEMYETQPTCWSWSDSSHHHVVINNRQRQVKFQCVLLFPSPFLSLSFSYISIFFYWTAAQEQPKLSPWTELSLPPHNTNVPTTTGSGMHRLAVRFHVLCNFLQMFHSYVEFFSIHHLWSYHRKIQNLAHRPCFATRPATLPCSHQ